jgi:hypothetical protein
MMDTDDCIAAVSRINELLFDLDQWSDKTFGSVGSRGPLGALKHLVLEAQEAVDDPESDEEYADCFLLILDAWRRHRGSFESLIRASKAKMLINRARTWPVPTNPNEAVMHVVTSIQNGTAFIGTALYEQVRPNPVVIFCPECGLKHIDVDDDTGKWATTRLHRKHLCKPSDGGCSNVWQPFDSYTVGVESLAENNVVPDEMRDRECIYCRDLITEFTQREYDGACELCAAENCNHKLRSDPTKCLSCGRRDGQHEFSCPSGNFTYPVVADAMF